MRITIRPVIGFVLLTVPTQASVLNLSFPGLSSTAGLALSGNAAVTTTSDGKVLRLTPPLSFQAGGAFSSTSIAFNGSSDSFSTFFQFRITNVGGIDPADGFVFVIQPLSSSIGGSGSGIGYSGILNS